MRDKNGRFIRGSIGWWKGLKRPKQSKENNVRWSGGLQKVICLQCNKNYFVSKSRLTKTKFCSHSCRAKYRFTGEKNINWKGGVSSWKDSVKNSPEYKKWRMSIFQRDRFTCKKCGHRSKKSRKHGDKSSDIHAHHIEPMRNFQDKWFEITNGITLCVDCHRMTYGKEEIFIKDFKRILNDYMPENPKG